MKPLVLTFWGQSQPPKGLTTKTSTRVISPNNPTPSPKRSFTRKRGRCLPRQLCSGCSNLHSPNRMILLTPLTDLSCLGQGIRQDISRDSTTGRPGLDRSSRLGRTGNHKGETPRPSISQDTILKQLPLSRPPKYRRVQLRRKPKLPCLPTHVPSSCRRTYNCIRISSFLNRNKFRSRETSRPRTSDFRGTG